MMSIVSDYMLLIPHLSKELNLIGLPSLPYTVKNVSKSKTKNRTGDETLKIVFDSNLMIKILTSACYELVKQIKAFGGVDNTHLDKLRFENIKLEKQLKLFKSDLEKKITELAAAKEVNRQLQEKVSWLEKDIKDYKVGQKSLTNKHQIDEDLLKHSIKKKESCIFDLHKTIWKQFNLANENYFPENFKMIQLNQPNFNHLWSTVKYSDAKTKEEALKEAVCVLQKNNNDLAEENFMLKTCFFNIFNEFQESLRLMVEKMHIPKFASLDYKSSDLFFNLENLNVSVFNSVLKDVLKTVTKICELFDKASFTVSDDLFICWTHIIKSL